jgi:hypothetical protein
MHILSHMVKKGENNPSELKNGIWAPKSVYSCDISIVLNGASKNELFRSERQK